MALRCVLRKIPALGLRSPAGSLMGPVHAPSPAAVFRYTSSHAPPKKYVDPSPRLNKLWEAIDQNIATQEKLYKDSLEMFRRGSDKYDKRAKASVCAVLAFSGFALLRHMF